MSMPGTGHVRAEAVDGDHRRREEELRAKLRDLPGVDERLPELVVHSSALPVDAQSSSALPPAASILATALCENSAARTVSATPMSPPPRILMGVRVFLTMPFSTSASGVTSSPAAKARGQAADVDRHRVRAERADGHALLHVRAAQLAEPHVERHLTALVARAHAAAGAGVVALVALAGGLALAGALAAAEALGVLGGARVGAQVVES